MMQRYFQGVHMRVLALLTTVGLALIGTVSVADAASRRITSYPASGYSGLPYGGYYRTAPLTTRYGDFRQVGIGSYYDFERY
jgi:hypothetical protein